MGLGSVYGMFVMSEGGCRMKKDGGEHQELYRVSVFLTTNEVTWS